MDNRRSTNAKAPNIASAGEPLGFFEEIGVVPHVEQFAGEQEHPESDIVWLDLVARLRSTGMSLETIRRYAELAEVGPSTITQRRDMLAAHREALAREATRLVEFNALLQRKIAQDDRAGPNDDPAVRAVKSPTAASPVARIPATPLVEPAKS